VVLRHRANALNFYCPPSLILRPDWFMDTKPHGAVLQKIVGGFRRGPFMRSSEEKLRQFIHHEALKRAGLPWPPPDNHQVRWWATDEKQQARKSRHLSRPALALALRYQRFAR
jgi:hypothetical protein